jgi:rubredoxin-NAD+ reductase
MQGLADAAMTVNHLDDYRRFRDRLVASAPVLVIGGGLIGIEFAADLSSQGHEVHVVDPGPGALPRLLPPGAARLLERALADAGVKTYWNRTVGRIDAHAGGYRATLSDGNTIDAATVLSAVGLRPNTALAAAAGLAVGRGIRVNGALRAAPHHYALGDCVELPGGILLPFIKPIGEQARYIARTLAGEPQGDYVPGNYAIHVKVPFWPVASTSPLPDEAGTWHEETTEAGSLARLVAADETVLRVVATGDRTPELRGWLGQVPTLAGLPLAATP